MSVVTFVIVAILEARTSISIAVLHSVPSGLLAITVYVPGLYTSAIMSSPTTPVWSLPFLYHTYSYSSCGFKTVNVLGRSLRQIYCGLSTSNSGCWLTLKDTY